MGAHMKQNLLLIKSPSMTQSSSGLVGTQGGAWGPGQTALTAELTECQGQGIVLLFLQVQETLKAHEEVASSFRERYIPRFKAASGYTKNCSRMETPSLHCILFRNAGTWFFNTNVTPWKYNQHILRVAMNSTLDKHYQWWVHLLGIMEVRLSTSWTAVCKNDQIANILLASEDWEPGHAQPFFLSAKFLQESNF